MLIRWKYLIWPRLSCLKIRNFIQLEENDRNEWRYNERGKKICENCESFTELIFESVGGKENHGTVSKSNKHNHSKQYLDISFLRRFAWSVGASFVQKSGCHSVLESKRREDNPTAIFSMLIRQARATCNSATSVRYLWLPSFFLPCTPAIVRKSRTYWISNVRTNIWKYNRIFNIN